MGLRTCISRLGLGAASAMTGPTGGIRVHVHQDCFRVWGGPADEWPHGIGVHGQVGARIKVCHLGYEAAPQMNGPAGLGCAANGTARKGISFRV